MKSAWSVPFVTRARTHAFAAALLAASTLSAQEQRAHPGPWEADFDVAVARAKKENKDLLVDFTGSDWCGWCVKLDQEVFSQKAFLDAVKDRYVLVALDFPRRSPAVDNVPNPKRNAEVAATYRVSGYPSVLLLTADGDVIGKTGYQEGGAQAYVKSLEALAKEGKRNLAFLADLAGRLQKSKGEPRRELLRQVIEQLAQMSTEHYGVRGMAKFARQALQLDPKNEHGLRNAALRAIVLAGVADDEVLTTIRREDQSNQQGLYELLAVDAVMKVRSVKHIKAAVQLIQSVDKFGFKDQQLATFLFTNAALWTAEHLKDAARAASLAQKAIDAGASGQELATLNKIVAKGK